MYPKPLMKKSVLRVLVSPIAPSQLGPVFAGLTSGTAFFVTSPQTKAYDKLHFLFTNFHVVQSGGAIELSLHGKSYPCKLVAAVPTEDLALVQVETKDLDFRPEPLELDTSPIRATTAVVAYGFPNGREEMTVTTGHVSSVFMVNGHELVSHSCTLETGNSGGPLIDAATGKVLSINSMITERENLSLPAYRLQMFLEPMLKTPLVRVDMSAVAEEVKRRWVEHEIAGRLRLSDGSTRPVSIEEWVQKEAVPETKRQEIFEHLRLGDVLKAANLHRDTIKMPQQRVFHPINTTMEFTPSALSPRVQDYYGVQGVGVIIGNDKLGLSPGDLLTNIDDQVIDAHGYVGETHLNMILRRVGFDQRVKFRVIQPGGSAKEVSFTNTIHDGQTSAQGNKVINIGGVIVAQQTSGHAAVVGVTPRCKAFQSLAVAPGHRLVTVDHKKDFDLSALANAAPKMLQFEHPTTLKSSYLVM